MALPWALVHERDVGIVLCSAGQRAPRSSLAPLVVATAGPRAGSVAYFVYVDNLCTWCTLEGGARRAVDELAEEFGAWNLDLHGCAVSSNAPALGCDRDGIAVAAGISTKRYWKVRLSFRAVRLRGRASGRMLEVLIGHGTYCALLNRPLLSVFHTVYAFI